MGPTLDVLGRDGLSGLTDLCILLPLRIKTSRSVLFCLIFINIEFGTDGFHKTVADFSESD